MKELENLIIKFGDEKWINKLYSGEIFMQPLKYYIDLEREEKKKGQGDKNEATLRSKLIDYEFSCENSNKETDLFIKLLNSGENATFTFRYKDDERYLTSCFYKVDADRFIFIFEEDDKKYYKYEFTNEEKEIFGYWGNSALIINSEIFFNVVRSHLSNTESILGKIKYYSDNNLPVDLLLDYQQRKINRLLWKDDFFKHQNEYRFIIAEKSDKGKVVANIGILEKISMKCNSSELLIDGFIYTI